MGVYVCMVGVMQWRNRRGGRVPPIETSDREILALSGKKKKEARKKEKG